MVVIMIENTAGTGWAIRKLENGLIESVPWSGKKLRTDAQGKQMWGDHSAEEIGITPGDLALIATQLDFLGHVFNNYEPLPRSEPRKEGVVEDMQAI